MTIKAKAKAKDSKFVLEDTSKPRTKTKVNNTGRILHVTAAACGQNVLYVARIQIPKVVCCACILRRKSSSFYMHLEFEHV